MQSLSEFLVEEGAEICCLVHNHRRSLRLEKENMRGVIVYRTPIVGRLLYTPLAPLYPFHLLQVIRECKPDVLHVHMPNVSAFWLVFLNWFLRLPIILHWHSDVIGSSAGSALRLAYIVYRPFERALLGLSIKIIITSANYGRSSKPLQKFQLKTCVVPLGLPDRQTEEKKEYSLKISPPLKLKLLCVGRLTYYKGHKYLLQAMRNIPEAFLVIVGSGEEKGRLERQIEQQGLHGNVSLLGDVEESELAQLFSNCDCVVLPSIERTEAFGMVLLESMRAQKAVITSDIPGAAMSWIVQQDSTGKLVTPASTDELAGAIQWMLQNPMRCRDMGVAGRKRFLGLFTLDRVAKKIQTLYEEAKSNSVSK